MSFLDEIFNKLFPKEQPNHKIAVQEELQRSSSYQEAYTNWKSSSEATLLLERIKKSYNMKKTGMEGLYPVHLFNSAAANGFALSYHPTISRREFHFLLDYWRDKMLSLDYRLANTDTQTKDKGEYVQTTEKHYLKPPITRNKPKAEQHYGNILLEYVLVDDQPSYLKLMITTYKDHLFTEAKPHEELLEKLFEEKD